MSSYRPHVAALPQCDTLVAHRASHGVGRTRADGLEMTYSRADGLEITYSRADESNIATIIFKRVADDAT